MNKIKKKTNQKKHLALENKSRNYILPCVHMVQNIDYFNNIFIIFYLY